MELGRSACVCGRTASLFLLLSTSGSPILSNTGMPTTMTFCFFSANLPWSMLLSPMCCFVQVCTTAARASANPGQKAESAQPNHTIKQRYLEFRTKIRWLGQDRGTCARWACAAVAARLPLGGPEPASKARTTEIPAVRPEIGNYFIGGNRE